MSDRQLKGIGVSPGIGVGAAFSRVRKPRFRISRTFSHSSRLCVTTTPPSPHAFSVFRGCRLKQPASPKEPTRRPLYSAVTAWAASSMTINPCREAI